MNQKIKLHSVIPENLAGTRLDRALALIFPDYSRTRLKEWLTSGQIKLDGHTAEPKQKVKGDEVIEILAELPPEPSMEAQDIPLAIIYEDRSILIINKPVGLVVHPAAGNPDHTLLNALLHHAPTLATLPRAGLVHRIDKDTSGLLVVAKTLEAHTSLVKQLQDKTVNREYQAIVKGECISGGTVDAPIARHPQQRTHMAVIENGKPAVTHYRILEKFKGYTRLKVILETGRTHQIRVHMAHINYPIVGDQTYGGGLKVPANTTDDRKQVLRQFKRQALHAERLGLIHPDTKEAIVFEAPLPEDMLNLLKTLRS
jgi:23S rRNA pseudouridine1911/1915/1917 synthase